MPIFLHALLCGIAGAITAHITYTQSNLFILGDTIRHGRHPLFDPLAFDLSGLLWGLLVGAVCGAWLRSLGPGKTVPLGLAATLLGVGIVGGGATFSRYLDLPLNPPLDRKDIVLEFELRLPVVEDPALEFPRSGTIGSGLRNIATLELPQKETRDGAGRIVFPGKVALLRAEERREVRIELGRGQRHDLLRLYYVLPLPAVPTVADAAWSDWLTATAEWYWTDGTRQGHPPKKDYQFRYRVRFGVHG